MQLSTRIINPSNFMKSAAVSLWTTPVSMRATLLNFDQRRGIADEKAVKNRMRSVQSIQKITKAMKMVAASKLRADQRRREMGLPFCRPVMDVFDKLSIDETTKDSKGVLLICLSSDKGLCGGVNSSVAKSARTSIRSEEEEGRSVTVFGVGEKVRAALQRVFGNRFGIIVNETAKTPLNFGTAALLAEKIISVGHLLDCASESSSFKFKSVIAYDTEKRSILSPSSVDKVSSKSIDATLDHQISKKPLDEFEFEPEQSLIWRDLYEFYVACSTFSFMLESAATEQSQRMSAMDNASKNAGEMLSGLTLTYNKARQMKITMELIEIISGANAL